MALDQKSQTFADTSNDHEIIPNRGRAVEDYISAGNESISQVDFQKANGIDPSSQIRLVKVSHMRYQHPDLHEITVFLRDFGLTVAKQTENEIWYRGYSTDQYVYYARTGPKEFLGGTFEVESYEDLEKAKNLPGAKVKSNGIEELKSAPGGGFMITLVDPDGFLINLIYGQTPALAKVVPEKIILNDEWINLESESFNDSMLAQQQYTKQLGHFGLVVKNFETQFGFYTKNFNLVPSNLLYVPGPDGKRKNVAMFAHIDRGEELVDHHTMFLTSLEHGSPHIHHCSFEVHDFDTQALGHDWLTRKGYKSAWGLGRHILGSQIFDYWYDPNDFMVEHYADGDVVNKDTPVSLDPAASARDAAWGPDIPPTFLD